MHELDKTGLEAACWAVSGVSISDPFGYGAKTRHVLSAAITAYLSSTSAGVTEEQTPRVTEALRCLEELANMPLGISLEDWGRLSSPILVALEASRSPVSQKEAEPVAWRWRSRIKGGAWDAWESGRYGRVVPPFMEVEERALYASPAPAGEPGISERLYDPDEPMADGEIRMTAAENVLGWLLIEKIGVPDDRNYSPNEAQEILVRRLDYANEMENERIRSALHPSPTPVSAPAGEPGIKALIWRLHVARAGWLVADVHPGSYFAWELAGIGYWSHGSIVGREVLGGIDAAKAAAQADYERRIRSALVHPTPVSAPAGEPVGGGK